MSLPPGLCGTCQHVKRTVTKRDSVFYLCLRAQTDPALRKYPPLPVLRCHGYTAQDVAAEESAAVPRDRN